MTKAEGKVNRESIIVGRERADTSFFSRSLDCKRKITVADVTGRHGAMVAGIHRPQRL
jgi:hypothetical protein